MLSPAERGREALHSSIRRVRFQQGIELPIDLEVDLARTSLHVDLRVCVTLYPQNGHRIAHHMYAVNTMYVVVLTDALMHPLISSIRVGRGQQSATISAPRASLCGESALSRNEEEKEPESPADSFPQHAPGPWHGSGRAWNLCWTVSWLVLRANSFFSAIRLQIPLICFRMTASDLLHLCGTH